MEQPALKDVLKSVTTINGALSVMTHGLSRMLTLPVDNLDFIAPVK